MMSILFLSGEKKKRQAFTLIELLVVIAIIAILAAILFPVFAQAREKARAITCINNTKQIAMGLTMYVQDNDERFFEFAWRPGGTTNYNLTFWTEKIMPYIKNKGVFDCPDQAGEASFSTSPWPTPSPVYHVAYSLSAHIFNENGITDESTGEFVTKSLASISSPAEIGMVGDGRWTFSYPNCYPDGSNGYYISYWDWSSNKNFPYGDWTGPIDDSPAGDPHHSGGSNFAFADGHSKFSRLTKPATPPGADASYVTGLYHGVKMVDGQYSTYDSCIASSN